MATIFLIRHAETDFVGQAVSGRLPGVSLNRVGVTQAKRLASRLKGVRLAAVYSSPLERALETSARLGLSVTTREGLIEIDFGAWTGLGFDELTSDPQWRLFNTFRSLHGPPGGESMLEVQTRIVTELTCLAARHPSDAIAAISHGDVIRAAVAYFAGIPLDLLQRFEISPASVTALKLSPESAQLLCVNDTGELSRFGA